MAGNNSIKLRMMKKAKQIKSCTRYGNTEMLLQ